MKVWKMGCERLIWDGCISYQLLEVSYCEYFGIGVKRKGTENPLTHAECTKIITFFIIDHCPRVDW